MTTAITPVRLLPNQIVEAAAMMGRAAANDPLFNYCLPDEPDRAEKVASFMQMILRIGLVHGEVWATPGPITGIAAWLAPDHSMISQEDRETTGWSSVRQVWGSDAISRFEAFLADIGEANERASHDPHWYLMWVCVELGHQGQGIGSGLIREVLSQAVEQGVACHLQTYTAHNVAIYERLGFGVSQDMAMPRSGIQRWYMVRPPAS